MDILQSIVLHHVDSSCAFSAQALEGDWGGTMEKEGTCWFQFACCSYQSHPMHVASPWLQQWFPTYSIILLFANHLHHLPLPYLTPQGVARTRWEVTEKGQKKGWVRSPSRVLNLTDKLTLLIAERFSQLTSSRAYQRCTSNMWTFVESQLDEF